MRPAPRWLQFPVRDSSVVGHLSEGAFDREVNELHTHAASLN